MQITRDVFFRFCIRDAQGRPHRPGFPNSCFRPETPILYLSSLLTNNEGRRRKLGSPQLLKGRGLGPYRASKIQNGENEEP